MTQLSLDRQGDVLAVVSVHADSFREGFAAWLVDNWSIYRRFEEEALKVRRRGRDHWGANTIIEYLRHQTALEDSGGEWKVNDRWTSSVARLAALVNPELATFFEFRERRHGGVVKTPAPLEARP